MGFMRVLCFLFVCLTVSTLALPQGNVARDIQNHQTEIFENDACPDFIREGDIAGVSEGRLLQIMLVRHGEPAMKKKGWRNRNEAIRYTEMYDSVGVYAFDKKPVCLRQYDLHTVYTSKLPRAIHTAELTIEGMLPLTSMDIFNEFERKIIEFPNIKLPMKFWSVTTRVVWMMGFNDKGIESFREAKDRAGQAAILLDSAAQEEGRVLLFAHGFLNKYVRKNLKKQGYHEINFNGQKYLGVYYFYKTKP
jgi:hypothetical protein